MSKVKGKFAGPTAQGVADYRDLAPCFHMTKSCVNFKVTLSPLGRAGGYLKLVPCSILAVARSVGRPLERHFPLLEPVWAHLVNFLAFHMLFDGLLVPSRSICGLFLVPPGML